MKEEILNDIDNVEINKVRVSKFDDIYCNLLKQIINNGIKSKNRTGIDTLCIEGFNFKLENIQENFPILQSKKVVIKNALSEILWIHQAQSNNVNWLIERGNNIWNEWKIDKDGIYRVYEPTGEFVEKEIQVVNPYGKNVYDYYGDEMKAKSLVEGKTIKKAIYYGTEYADTIGTAYGWINNKFKRPQELLKTIKEDPDNRRMNISLWQDEYIKTGTLPPCVWSTEYRVINDTLNCYVHQRSADVPLGLPFNVSQYAILLNLFANVSNLNAGTLNYSIMDAHIYENQLDGIKTQFKYYETMKEIENIAIKNDKRLLVDYYKNIKNNLQMYINDENKYNEENIKLKAFDLMINNDKPTLKIKENDDFFKINNMVNNDKEYLKENPTGNEDIKLLNYKSMPFIKMPIAQ